MRLILAALLSLLPAAEGWAAGSRSLGGPKGAPLTAPIVSVPGLGLPLAPVIGPNRPSLALPNAGSAGPGTTRPGPSLPAAVPSLPQAAAAAPHGAKGPEAKASASAGPAAPQGPEGPKDEDKASAEKRSVQAGALFDGIAARKQSTAVRWLGLLSGFTAIRSVWTSPQLGNAAGDLLDRLTPVSKRIEAAKKLAALNRPESLEALGAAAVFDADASVREAAAQALATVAASWQRSLEREAALSPRAGRRAAALRSLGSIARVFDASTAVDRLAASAAVDRDEDNRLIAIEALGEARSPKALVALWRLRGGIEEPVLVSAIQLAIARAESRHSASTVPLAAYRPPEGDLGGTAKQPLHYAALKKVIGVAAVFTVVELIGSVVTGSVALKADAMHLAADLAVSVGALAVIWVGRRPPSSRKTYGYLKLEPVMGLASALFITGMGLFAAYEAVGRIITPAAVPGWETMLFAVAGLLSNAVSTWLLWRYKDESLSIKGAFLHAALDAVGSIGIIVSTALAISLGWVLADPIVTLGIVALVLHSTWDLAKRSWNVLIDAVPPGLDIDELEKELTNIAGVVAVYDLHAWSLNSAERSGTAVVLVAPGTDRDAVLAAAKKAFESRGISHSTVEVRPTPAPTGGV